MRTGDGWPTLSQRRVSIRARFHVPSRPEAPELPYTFVSSHLTVPGKIKDEPVRFVLTTGASKRLYPAITHDVIAADESGPRGAWTATIVRAARSRHDHRRKNGKVHEKR